MNRKAKLMVVAAFGARVPVIVAAAFRLHYLHTTLKSADRTLYGSYYAIATRWHLGYAVMSITITGLGPFLRPFSKSSPSSYHPSTFGHEQHITPEGNSHGKSRIEPVAEGFEMQRRKICTTVFPSTICIAEGSSNSSQTPILAPGFESAGPGIIMKVTSEERVYVEAESRLSGESQEWIMAKKT